MIKISLVLCLVLACALATTNITSKTLVVLDNKELHNTHTKFFAELEKFGQVTYAYSFSDREVPLKYYGEYIYDRLVVFCTSEQEQANGALKVPNIIEFFDSGRDVIVAGDIDISRGYRKLFYAFGVEPDEVGHQLKDNFLNYKNSSNTIVSTHIEDAYPFISEKLRQGKILYRGLGLKLVNYVNHQLFPIAKGEPTTYSKNYQNGQAVRAGSAITLIAAVQGLNNARAVLTGSLDFFSDQFWNVPDFDNSALAANLLRWNFKRSGILRVNNVQYRGVGETGSKSLFTVTERVHYQADIEEFNHKTNSWVPYVANDMNVEFVMLDPWVIKRLEQVQQTKTYVAEFDTPTKEGIYQFKVIYEKPGFNFLAEKARVTLRTKKHDQFERFLLTATPYYTAIFATIAGTFIFIVFFLYSRTKEHKE